VLGVRLIKDGLQAGLAGVFVRVLTLDKLKKSVSVDLSRDEGRVAAFIFKSQRVHFDQLRNGVQEQDKYGVDSVTAGVTVSVRVLIFFFISNSEKRHSLGHQPTTAFFISVRLSFIFFLILCLFF
jgi:hypothetical protein